MASRLTVKQSKKDRPKSSSCLSCRLLSMGSQFGDELYRRHGDRIIKCLFPGDKKAMLSSEDRLRSPEAGNTLSDDSKGVGLTGEEVLRGEDISSLAVDLETFRQVRNILRDRLHIVYLLFGVSAACAEASNRS